jgi:hypothetical protein
MIMNMKNEEALAALSSLEKLLPSLTGGLLLTECAIKCRTIRAALEPAPRDQNEVIRFPTVPPGHELTRLAWTTTAEPVKGTP